MRTGTTVAAWTSKGRTSTWGSSVTIDGKTSARASTRSASSSARAASSACAPEPIAPASLTMLDSSSSRLAGVPSVSAPSRSRTRSDPPSTRLSSSAMPAIARACSVTARGSASEAAWRSSSVAPDRVAMSWSAGCSTSCDLATTPVSTDALISCTASWAAIATAVRSIGSILLWSTSIWARSPFSTLCSGFPGKMTTTSRSPSSSFSRAEPSSDVKPCGSTNRSSTSR